MYINVTREQPDKLTRERWEFYVQDDIRTSGGKITVILSRWSADSRATRRHDYHSDSVFYSLDTRNGDAIPPAIPQDVLDEAREEIIKSIDFSRVLERVEAMQERKERRRAAYGG